MKLAILGAPGAGKGTQSRNLATHYGLKHISTGDILRMEMQNKTKIGLEIFDRMNDGCFVPDNIITELLFKRLSQDDVKNGFILDGYPRNLAQAETLEKVFSLTNVISVEVPDQVILERVTGRYVCKNCNEVYHTHYHPPKVNLICDICNNQLIKRDDDKTKTVKERLKIYHDITEPVKIFYEKNEKLIMVQGVADILDITNEIIMCLDKQFDKI